MRGSSRSSAVALAALLAATSGCAGLRGAPTGRAGWLGYRVGALAIELPEGWGAKGDASRLSAESPDGAAVAMAERVARTFPSAAECLEQAEQALARGAGALERSRRHPTRLGGRAAVVQEADRGGWHGWAWGICDGAQQYRVSFLGRSPMAPEVVEAQRGIERSVRFDGARGAAPP